MRKALGLKPRRYKPDGGDTGGELTIASLADGTIAVTCKNCSFANPFNQPYPYHAGFGNQGFLYNEAGDLTLVWSSYDPAYHAIVGSLTQPWALDGVQRSELESKLLPSPQGGNWKFVNPARCLKCRLPISGPIMDTIYYLQYANSVDTDEPDGTNSFAKVLKGSA